MKETKTKEQLSSEYADEKLKKAIKRMSPYGEIEEHFDCIDIMRAWRDGYAACEQSMWRSVEDELPEEGQPIIIRIVQKEAKSGKMFESYFNTFYSKQYGFDIEERQQRGKISKVTHWMPKPDLPLPSLPDTNTEKL